MMVSANVGVEGRSGSLGGRPEIEMVRARLPDDDEGGGRGELGPDDELERRWWSRRKYEKTGMIDVRPRLFYLFLFFFAAACASPPPPPSGSRCVENAETHPLLVYNVERCLIFFLFFLFFFFSFAAFVEGGLGVVWNVVICRQGQSSRMRDKSMMIKRKTKSICR
jgi:hypothetical protein